MDNQRAAQLLFEHKLATREQILACWPEITPAKDIGLLLVEQGVLPRATYDQLVQHLGAAAGPVVATAAGAPEAASAKAAAPGEIPPAAKAAEASRADRAPATDDPSWSAKPAPAPGKASAATAPPARPKSTPGSVPATVGPDSAWEDLLRYARGRDASDLHLTSGNPILLRRFGALQPVGQAPLEAAQVRRWVEEALDPARLAEFDARGDLEFVYEIPGEGRYRAAFLRQRRGPDITVRLVPARIRSFEESGLPESCRELTQWAQGMVLVTGPVGSGKSSTLATLVELVNQGRHDHIITLEDPIETVFEPAGCRITQRQIGRHTKSQDAALRAALREDPDIIVIAELRDLETIRLAVSAAETGHLVFGTMNTTNASRTITRLVDSFPPEEQGVVRNMVSESLRGVISQQLLPLADGTGVAPAYEVLLVNTAVANMIRKDEIHQLGTAMLSGKSAGMVLLDDSLKALVERGLVEAREAATRATNPKDFERPGARGGR